MVTSPYSAKKEFTANAHRDTHVNRNANACLCIRERNLYPLLYVNLRACVCGEKTEDIVCLSQLRMCLSFYLNYFCFR